MNLFKRAVVGAVSVATLIAPMGLGAVAHAAQVSCDTFEEQICQLQPETTPLECSGIDGEIPISGITDGCDLAVDKQVSINGGAFAEADTSADAAQAQVGDTVTWQVTVTNTSSSEDQDFTPYGNLTVEDVLPSGAAFDSYTASAGTYASNEWTFSLEGNLPATLTITSHAVSTGLFENTATLSAYDPCNDGCNGAGNYADSNPDNNSNSAWFDPAAKPVVLADTTTLVNTGSGTAESFIAAGLIIATLAVGASSRFARKRTYNIN